MSERTGKRKNRIGRVYAGVVATTAVAVATASPAAADHEQGSPDGICYNENSHSPNTPLIEPIWGWSGQVEDWEFRTCSVERVGPADFGGNYYCDGPSGATIRSVYKPAGDIHGVLTTNNVVTCDGTARSLLPFPQGPNGQANWYHVHLRGDGTYTSWNFNLK